MGIKEIEQLVKKTIANELNIEISEVKLNSSLTNDLSADSLEVVEIMMVLEKEFDIEIPEETAKTMSTIEDIVNFISKK